LEERRQARCATRADEPEPTILCRAEDQIVAAKQTESSGDVTGGECRDIAADEHHWSRRVGRERAAHANAEITSALTGNRNTSAPVPGMAACRVRCHRNARPPAPISGEPTEYKPDHHTLEADRRDIADFPRKPALAMAQLGRANKQHEVTAHQR
jgi:hypothetical protein